MIHRLDPYHLHHGPYNAPALRRGDRATCLFRDGDVIITGWSDARIAWPRCRRPGTHGGGSGLLVDEEPGRLGDYAALPWASVVSIEWEGNRDTAFVGPARYEGQWLLPILQGIEPGTDQRAIEDRAKELRAFLGVECRSV